MAMTKLVRTLLILIIFIEYVGFATIGLLQVLSSKSLRQPRSQLVSNRAQNITKLTMHRRWVICKIQKLSVTFVGLDQLT